MDKSKALTYHYDQDEDILYVSLGEFTPSVCVEQDDGLLVRLDPDSGEVVGFTILDFALRATERIVTPIQAQFSLPQETEKIFV
jgi:uncharacterized protein YuzE